MQTQVSTPASSKRLIATYIYRMADGTVGYIKERLQAPGGEKSFRVRHLGPKGRYRNRKGDRDPVLYNLPAVVRAIWLGIEIWLCEGEKDADALIARGLVATTTAGGARDVPAVLAVLLAGARVRVLLDDDAEGRLRARLIEDVLRGHVDSLSFRLPATGRGTDAYDHFVVAGLGEEDLLPFLVVRFAGEESHATRHHNPTPSGSTVTGDTSSIPEVIYADKVAELTAAREERNNTLFGVAKYLFRFAHGGTFDYGRVWSDLSRIARDLGLDKGETRDTLASASRIAAKRPRTWVPRARRTASDEAFIDQFEAAILANAWAGKKGQHLRAVLLALVEVLRESRFAPSDFLASERMILMALGSGHRESIRAAFDSLQVLGWIKRIAAGDENGRAARWALLLPNSPVVPSGRLSDSHLQGTQFFPASTSGRFARVLPITHAAFLPCCWGFSAHAVLSAMDSHRPRTYEELTTETGLSLGTIRRVFARLRSDGAVLRRDDGWIHAGVKLATIADSAAKLSRAAACKADFVERISREQEAFKNFVTWKTTPPGERPRMETGEEKEVLVLRDWRDSKGA